MTGLDWTELAAGLGGVLVYGAGTWARSNDRSGISQSRRRTIAIVVYTCVTAVVLAGNCWLIVRWARHAGQFPILPILTALAWLMVYSRAVRSTRSGKSP